MHELHQFQAMKNRCTFIKKGISLWSVVVLGSATSLAHADVSSQHVAPVSANTTAVTSQTVVGLGMPLERAAWMAYDITIFPNGRGLPPGQGSVAQGRKLYAAQCAACHGQRGIEGPAARLVGSDGFIGWDDLLRPIRIAKYPLLVQSVGARWPYATTLFDYIRRAMPSYAPKSLKSDEVYALTAFLLNLNGLVDETAVMNAHSLPKIVMPAAAKSVMGE
jgi:cytochrome c